MTAMGLLRSATTELLAQLWEPPVGGSSPEKAVGSGGSLCYCPCPLPGQVPQCINPFPFSPLHSFALVHLCTAQHGRYPALLWWLSPWHRMLNQHSGLRGFHHHSHCVQGASVHRIAALVHQTSDLPTTVCLFRGITGGGMGAADTKCHPRQVIPKCPHLLQDKCEMVASLLAAAHG